jgi:hypoxanthine phosphoribosyltransferase
MKQIQQVFDTAECLYSMTDIDAALERVAATLIAHYADVNPLLLCVMNGSVITAGHLLPKLPFPLELDYIHASRYGDKTVGGELTWHHSPLTAIENREVLLIEDIYDEGVTLQNLRSYCEQAGARTVKCVTLINKLHDNKVGTPPEFVGLTVPDRYVFGFGMDYRGYWRNAPGIYAVKEEQ